MKRPKKISFDETIFVEAKRQIQPTIEKTQFDRVSSELGNICNMMRNYIAKGDECYSQMQIVKKLQKRTAKLQKTLPKSIRSNLSEIQKVQNKMFGRCQSLIDQDLKENSDPEWHGYIGNDDN